MCQPLTESSFQLPQVPLSRRHRQCCLIADLPERQINPPLTDFFFFSCRNLAVREVILPGPIGEMRSESTEKHEITQMYIYLFFFSLPPSHTCIRKK